ncbi:MAG: type VI secretion system contractile sheath large subunit [Psychromonas sp.]|nr:type VI secretion system contractile sheath large subunit [Psychromonas sp.]
MSAEKELQAEEAVEATDAPSLSILEQAIGATKQTESSRAEELLRSLTEEALKGTVKWNKNISTTLNESVAAIDNAMSKQLAEIMHNDEFQKLEGSWRGVHHMVQNCETNANMKIQILSLSKDELHKDLSKAVEFDQSQMFKKIYEDEFGTAGGEPYAMIVGDYEFTNHPQDVEILSLMSNVSAAGFCPFISSVNPELFGFEDWGELSKPRDLEKVFESIEYTKWNAFRDSEDSRFVSLTMPRVLARLPYGEATKPLDEFNYEEFELNNEGTQAVTTHSEDYCWMNSAYTMATNIVNSFSEYGFCTAIRGAEGGGKVEGLATHVFTSDDGDQDIKCPTEIGITDRREAELSKLGFLPLCHYKNTDYAVFFGAQSCQKAKIYEDPDATANAAISTRLPYIMATARFAHYLKVMARDKIGGFMLPEDVESWLNQWIMNFVNETPGGNLSVRAKFPLAAAKVEVKEVPGQPGVYNAIAWLKPWLQMEELSASLRLVAKIPAAGK